MPSPIYRNPDGKPTDEIGALRVALRPLYALYGTTPAAEFGPLSLLAVRDSTIRSGYHRKSINVHVGRVKRMFRWAVEHELVPGEIYHALQAVAGLRKGRTVARETDLARPVAMEQVETIKTHVSRQIWGIVQAQLFTGARAGEIVIMRPADVDRSGSVWIYTPAHHKTQHHRPHAASDRASHRGAVRGLEPLGQERALVFKRSPGQCRCISRS